jgi:hypothetical protein
MAAWVQLLLLLWAATMAPLSSAQLQPNLIFNITTDTISPMFTWGLPESFSNASTGYVPWEVQYTNITDFVPGMYGVGYPSHYTWNDIAITVDNTPYVLQTQSIQRPAFGLFSPLSWAFHSIDYRLRDNYIGGADRYGCLPE